MKVGGVVLPRGLVIVVLLAVLLLALAAILLIPATDEGSRRLGMFLGLLAPTLLLLRGLLETAQAKEGVIATQASTAHIEETTNALADGLMDAKVKAATSEVVKEEVIPAIESATAEVVAATNGNGREH